ncbi:SRPBCC family protein [Actinokineospora sp. HUAS TT18]|uniref:SRPBCC family protein n=1 Tax=Actinokineospora sp. HUAS TT18 TaxID=3447451 RepID=UPI003F51E037
MLGDRRDTRAAIAAPPEQIERGVDYPATPVDAALLCLALDPRDGSEFKPAAIGSAEPLSCMTMQENTVTSTIVIDAPPARVWAVLTDFANYPDWHPSLEVLAGQAERGSALHMRIAAGTPAERVAEGEVLEVEPDRLLVWEGGMKGLLWGRHTFELTADGTATHLVNTESFTGAMAADVLTASRALLEAEFAAANEALKALVES